MTSQSEDQDWDTDNSGEDQDSDDYESDDDDVDPPPEGEDEDEDEEDEDEDEDYEDDDDDDDGDGDGDGDYTAESGALVPHDPNQTDTPVALYQPEYVPEDENAEEGEDGEEKPRDAEGRARVMACCICGCCLLLIALGILLGLLVFKNDDDGSPSSNSGGPGEPTFSPGSPGAMSPTFPSAQNSPTPQALSPSAKPPPTQFPTLSPAPSPAPFVEPTPKRTPFPTATPTLTAAPTAAVADEYTFIPIEDTYVTNGFKKFEATGDQDSFLIQNGPNEVNEIPDSFALLNFDLSRLPSNDRTRNRETSAYLEMTHVVAVRERGPATYTVVLLPSTRLKVETFHLGLFPEPTNGIDGPTFDVAPGDTAVSIDVSDLVFGNTSSDKTMFLMLVNRGEIQQAGDRFRSRETVDTDPDTGESYQPKLRVFYGPRQPTPPTPKPSANPTSSPKPSIAPTKSPAPSASPQPSQRTPSPTALATVASNITNTTNTTGS